MAGRAASRAASPKNRIFTGLTISQHGHLSSFRLHQHPRTLSVVCQWRPDIADKVDDLNTKTFHLHPAHTRGAGRRAAAERTRGESGRSGCDHACVLDSLWRLERIIEASAHTPQSYSRANQTQIRSTDLTVLQEHCNRTVYQYCNTLLRRTMSQRMSYQRSMNASRLQASRRALRRGIVWP